MKNVALLLLLFVCSRATHAEHSEKSDVKKVMPPQAMCNAAAPRLREWGLTRSC
jgi:hypothetical protein